MAQIKQNKPKFNPMTDAQRRSIFFLLRQLNLTKEVAEEMLPEWTSGRASHISETQFIDAMEIIKYLKSLSQNPRGQRANDDAKMDRKRKGLIKAVFAWYDSQGKVVDMKYVIGTICRAGGVERINDLTEADLQRLYAEFCRKQKAQTVINQEQIITFSNN